MQKEASRRSFFSIPSKSLFFMTPPPKIHVGAHSTNTI
jgi:hypothetical protein